MNVQTATKVPRTGSIESDAQAWMENPLAYFGESNTQIHSISRRDAEAIALKAMNLRLEQRRQQIPMLAKLADAQGIKEFKTLDDMAPLLFEHTMYKSYPTSLLAKQRYDQLTQWLNRLTPHDISGFDASGCKSIEDWLVKLQNDTPLDPLTSSGTSGTVSFFPRSKKDCRFTVRSMRVQMLTKFGAEPTEAELHGKYYMVTPLYRDGHSSSGRFAQYFKADLCQGDENYLLTAFPYKVSPDLMWLAAKLRAAAAKGDATKVDVPEVLLARRADLERMNAEQPAHRDALVKRLLELNGERVLVMSTSPMLWEVTQKGLSEGKTLSFAPGSILLGGGGAKGVVLPDGWEKKAIEFFGAERMMMSYGMTELNTFNVSCEYDHYHLAPWVTLFLLDLDSGRPLPRSGVQTGRASFFDPTHDGTWGGIITGDLLTVDWDTPCPCGRKTAVIKPKIQRVSEAQGGDDKISCAAQPGAQAEAMDFLLNLEI